VPVCVDVLVFSYSNNYSIHVQLRYNYRLYPSPGQQQALARAFGCARVVFNDALATRRDAHQAGRPYPSNGELSARLTAAKATPQRAWLGEVSAVVLQQALADLNAAYGNFFASLKGDRKGRKAGLPRFRSRKDRRQAIRFTRNARFAVTPGGKLRLPKIGDVPVRWSRRLPAVPSSVTVIRDAAGRYFASFVVQASEDLVPEADAETGIDLGLAHFAVLSDGRKIASPKFLRRAEGKLRKAQKALSRKAKGSRPHRRAISWASFPILGEIARRRASASASGISWRSRYARPGRGNRNREATRSKEPDGGIRGSTCSRSAALSISSSMRLPWRTER